MRAIHATDELELLDVKDQQVLHCAAWLIIKSPQSIAKLLWHVHMLNMGHSSLTVQIHRSHEQLKLVEDADHRG